MTILVQPRREKNPEKQTVENSWVEEEGGPVTYGSSLNLQKIVSKEKKNHLPEGKDQGPEQKKNKQKKKKKKKTKRSGEE